MDVLITGAARGIGAQTARLLAAKGHRVSLVGLEPDLLEQLAAELGDAHCWIAADVTDSASLDAAVAGTVERFGGIDTVLANAGIASYATVRIADPETFAKVIDVNLTGVFRTLHAAAPCLIERKGYALIVASLATYTPMPGLAAYAASKAGVESPANAVTTVDKCAAAIVRGIERRSRRVYVPRSVALVNAMRSVLTSPLADRLIGRRARDLVPKMEAEVTALGRQHQAH